jgi:hypothetical protein
MAKHEQCGADYPHREHRVNVGWEYDSYERCGGIPSADDLRRAEYREAKALVKHEKRMARLRRKAARYATA